MRVMEETDQQLVALQEEVEVVGFEVLEVQLQTAHLGAEAAAVEI
jgi:hypothetical protein